MRNNIFYAYEFEQPDDCGGIQYKQLLFGGTHPDLEWLEENKVRYVQQRKGEDETVKAFEKKYNVKCVWSSLGAGKDAHLGYKIIE